MPTAFDMKNSNIDIYEQVEKVLKMNRKYSDRNNLNQLHTTNSSKDPRTFSNADV